MNPKISNSNRNITNWTRVIQPQPGLASFFLHKNVLVFVLIISIATATTTTTTPAKCVPSQYVAHKDITYRIPYDASVSRCFYIFSTPDMVQQDTTITVRAKTTKGKVTFYAGATASDVWTNRKVKMVLDEDESGRFNFKTTWTSKIYFGVEPATLDTSGHFEWNTVPGI